VDVVKNLPSLGNFLTKKSKNHFEKKFTKKLREVRSRFVIGSADPALLTSPRPLLADLQASMPALPLCCH
jgi:hypothetical protein